LAYLVENKASSRLASAVSSSAATIPIDSDDASLFPSPTGSDSFFGTIRDAENIEIFECTSRSGANLTVSRGQQGTTAVAFSAGAVVELRATMGLYSSFEQKYVREYSGNPNGVVTPLYVGEKLKDTSGGVFWVAVSTTVWKFIGPNWPTYDGFYDKLTFHCGNYGGMDIIGNILCTNGGTVPTQQKGVLWLLSEDRHTITEGSFADVGSQAGPIRDALGRNFFWWGGYNGNHAVAGQSFTDKDTTSTYFAVKAPPRYAYGMCSRGNKAYFAHAATGAFSTGYIYEGQWDGTTMTVPRAYTSGDPFGYTANNPAINSDGTHIFLSYTGEEYISKFKISDMSLVHQTDFSAEGLNVDYPQTYRAPYCFAHGNAYYVPGSIYGVGAYHIFNMESDVEAEYVGYFWGSADNYSNIRCIAIDNDTEELYIVYSSGTTITVDRYGLNSPLAPYPIERKTATDASFSDIKSMCLDANYIYIRASSTILCIMER